MIGGKDPSSLCNTPNTKAREEILVEAERTCITAHWIYLFPFLFFRGAWHRTCFWHAWVLCPVHFSLSPPVHILIPADQLNHPMVLFFFFYFCRCFVPFVACRCRNMHKHTTSFLLILSSPLSPSFPRPISLTRSLFFFFKFFDALFAPNDVRDIKKKKILLFLVLVCFVHFEVFVFMLLLILLGICGEDGYTEKKSG
ncbi:MAG: hypothetical protein BYD32DRAFT_289251 [Podila humilis]|nr:MAG: hypothetical protein BYD32DRAFT_289251 [Podila humilis]